MDSVIIVGSQDKWWQNTHSDTPKLIPDFHEPNVLRSSLSF